MTVTMEFPRDHPLGPRILELAAQITERDGPDGEPPDHDPLREELASLLKQTVPDAMIEERRDPAPWRGEVSLELSEPPWRTEPKTYAVLDEGASDIMLIEWALSAELCRELIDIAEYIGGWSQSTQVAGGGASYTNANRTSTGQTIDGRKDARWARWDGLLCSALGSAAAMYGLWNPHLVARTKRCFDVMRYEVGQRFGLHVDAIAGSRWADRQLSALLYLNDDYQGGETLFPRQKIELKPAAGSIVAFPPFATHPHEAKPVTRGTKYAVVGWLYP